MALLWEDFLADARSAGISDDSGVEAWWGALQRCWNIPTRGADYLFFNRDYGAPAYFFAYAMSMARTYAPLLVDRTTGSGQGDGFGEAVQQSFSSPWGGRHSMLHDEPGRRGAPWRLYFQVISEDLEYASATWAGPKESCADISGFAPDSVAGRSTGRWDDFEINVTAGPDGEGENLGHVSLHLPPVADVQAFATSQDSRNYDHIFFPANRIAGSGAWSDLLMWYAWLGVNYAAHAPDAETLTARLNTHVRPAWLLGRAVLARVLDFSRLLVHEMGHSFNAHGHCVVEDGTENKAYFMEAALSPFTCGVTARLGLPRDGYHRPTEGPSKQNPQCGSTVSSTSAWNTPGRTAKCAIESPMSTHSRYSECSMGWCAGTEAAGCQSAESALGESVWPCASVTPWRDRSSGLVRCLCTPPALAELGLGGR